MLGDDGGRGLAGVVGVERWVSEVHLRGAHGVVMLLLVLMGHGEVLWVDGESVSGLIRGL